MAQLINKEPLRDYFTEGVGYLLLLFFLGGSFTGGFFGLGGGVVALPMRGGTARIKHLGPDPMRSSL